MKGRLGVVQRRKPHAGPQRQRQRTWKRHATSIRPMIQPPASGTLPATPPLFFRGRLDSNKTPAAEGSGESGEGDEAPLLTASFVDVPASPAGNPVRRRAAVQRGARPELQDPGATRLHCERNRPRALPAVSTQGSNVRWKSAITPHANADVRSVLPRDERLRCHWRRLHRGWQDDVDRGVPGGCGDHPGQGASPPSPARRRWARS